MRWQKVAMGEQMLLETVTYTPEGSILVKVKI